MPRRIGADTAHRYPLLESAVYGINMTRNAHPAALIAPACGMGHREPGDFSLIWIVFLLDNSLIWTIRLLEQISEGTTGDWWPPPLAVNATGLQRLWS